MREGGEEGEREGEEEEEEEEEEKEEEDLFVLRTLSNRFFNSQICLSSCSSSPIVSSPFSPSPSSFF